MRNLFLLLAFLAFGANADLTKYVVSYEWHNTSGTERDCIKTWSDGTVSHELDFRPWMPRASFQNASNVWMSVGYDTSVRQLLGNGTQTVTRCYRDAELVATITNVYREPTWASATVIGTNRTGVVVAYSNDFGLAWTTFVPFDRAQLLKPQLPSTSDVSEGVRGFTDAKLFRAYAKVIAPNLCEEFWTDGSVRTNSYPHMRLGNQTSEERHAIIGGDRVVSWKLDGRAVTNIITRLTSGRVGQSIYQRLSEATLAASNALERAGSLQRLSAANAARYVQATNSNARVVNWLETQKNKSMLPSTKAIYQAIIDRFKEAGND